ncbi:MAG: T9SS type A sorting domain-containing protein [Balneolaceae bacterium]
MKTIKIILILVGYLIVSIPVNAQSVVSSAAGFMENTSISLNFMTGEAIVGNFSNETINISGGLVGYDPHVILSNAPLTDLPKKFGLSQNYPNPFNPTTVISYDVPKQAHITLDVFNSIGVKVSTLVSATKAAGMHSIHFSAQNLSSGMYFYRLQADGNVITTKKMLLIK